MDILIDHRIRDWVFMPLIFVMFMVGIFRSYLSYYFDNVKVRDKVTSKDEYKDILDKNWIAKCQTLCKNSFILTPQSFY